MRRRAVFLDRDGVINRAYVSSGIPHPPASLAALEILEGVPEALERLKAAGFQLLVVSNQPDVARGITPRAVVEEINHHLQTQLPLDGILTCFHDDADVCECRKPKPGLLLAAASANDLNLSQSYMIGDRWSDMEAGRRAGCFACFVDCGYLERRPRLFDLRVSSLAEATTAILRREGI